MHLKVFLKLKKTQKTFSSGKKKKKTKPQKTQKNTKKKQKNHWAGFLRKKTGFFPTLPDGELLERDHQVLARLLARFAPAEAVTELAVGVLVQAAAARHREVAPHVLARLEVQVLDST
jgi:hypothetical protein